MSLSVDFKPIGSNVRLNSTAFRAAMKEGLTSVAKAIDQDFKKTTKSFSAATGEDKPLGGIPKFKSKILPDRAQVATRHRVYYYINFGTRPHVIAAKRAKSLRFRKDYRAKTYPGVLTSRPGGKSGPHQFRRMVSHPGTAARDFDLAIIKRNTTRIQTLINIALAKGARAAMRS
jgi:hypothetical protein